MYKKYNKILLVTLIAVAFSSSTQMQAKGRRRAPTPTPAPRPTPAPAPRPTPKPAPVPKINRAAIDNAIAERNNAEYYFNTTINNIQKLTTAKADTSKLLNQIKGSSSDLPKAESLMNQLNETVIKAENTFLDLNSAINNASLAASYSETFSKEPNTSAAAKNAASEAKNFAAKSSLNLNKASAAYNDIYAYQTQATTFISKIAAEKEVELETKEPTRRSTGFGRPEVTKSDYTEIGGILFVNKTNKELTIFNKKGNKLDIPKNGTKYQPSNNDWNEPRIKIGKKTYVYNWEFNVKKYKDNKLEEIDKMDKIPAAGKSQNATVAILTWDDYAEKVRLEVKEYK